MITHENVSTHGKHKRQSMLRACKRIESGNRGRKARNETKKCSDGEEDKFGNRHVDCIDRLLQSGSKGNDGACRVGTEGKGTN